MEIKQDTAARKRIAELGWVLDENGKNYTIESYRGKRLAFTSCGLTLEAAKKRVAEMEQMHSKHWYNYKIQEAIVLGSISTAN